MSVRVSLGLAFALAGCLSADANAMGAKEAYSVNNCAGTPNTITMIDLPDSKSCEDQSCLLYDYTNITIYQTVSCNVSDPHAYAEQVFSEFRYMIVEFYQGPDCTDLSYTLAFPASGDCRVASPQQSIMASLYSDGSATVNFYDDEICSNSTMTTLDLNSTEVSSGECFFGSAKFYGRHSGETTSDPILVPTTSGSSSDSSSGITDGSSSGTTSASTNGELSVEMSRGSSSIGTIAVAGIVVTVAMLAFAAIASLWWGRRQRRAGRNGGDGSKHLDSFASYPSPMTGQTSESSNSQSSQKPQGLAGLWDDEVIATARIPREKVIVHRVISRGGNGVVYFGSFNGYDVAIKTLVPEKRKCIKQVNAFLAEVKLMATLEHPRIVRFVGVAWDSLTDLCAVSEYLEGGDLRGLLASYEAQHHPVGFSRTKVTIAHHVSVGLTYLHSLALPILHRDLKSKNILLTDQLEAKLTDFGIARERVDSTMTAGVGTSLWMAPEVMMGKRYDDKADMFSFGVVLSELDSHELPYSHTKEAGDSGLDMPETAVLQMVALGKLRVRFSPEALRSVAELGKECVSTDPKDRPTAAEALYRLQTALKNEL